MRVTAPAAIIVRLGDPPILTLIAALLIQIVARYPSYQKYQSAPPRIGLQPMVVFDGEGRFVAAVLRPAKRPSGKEIRAFLRRLLSAIRANWPATHILIRGDSHYCCPEVIDFCRANGLDFFFGVAPSSTLRRHVEPLEASTKARFGALLTNFGTLCIIAVS